MKPLSLYTLSVSPNFAQRLIPKYPSAICHSLNCPSHSHGLHPCHWSGSGDLLWICIPYTRGWNRQACSSLTWDGSEVVIWPWLRRILHLPPLPGFWKHVVHEQGMRMTGGDDRFDCSFQWFRRGLGNLSFWKPQKFKTFCLKHLKCSCLFHSFLAFYFHSRKAHDLSPPVFYISFFYNDHIFVYDLLSSALGDGPTASFMLILAIII